VLDACRDRGLSVPHDISVVGFDNMDIAAWSPYQLTTVQQPVVAMVDEAIAQIAAHLDSPANRLHSKVFPCDLVIRNSLARPDSRSD
jgi:DNA-binding LacI/PurR family transcriptional regulator